MDGFREPDAASARPQLQGSIDPERGDAAWSLVAMLQSLGIKQAFGVSGGAMASLWRALSLGLESLHFRHEAGAAFAAAEAYFATGRPVALFTTTGPGLTNALTGVLAGRDDGAKIILISAFSPAVNRGRWGIQETSGFTLPLGGLYTRGPFIDHACIVEHPAQLLQVGRSVASGLARKGGFVAHISVPTNVQRMPGVHVDQTPLSVLADDPSAAVVDQCAQVLASGSFGIWLGFGAREAAGPIRALAERTGAAVMCSPRGKGIFPEDHPQFVGVTGLAGHGSVTEYMARHKPQRLLVLGTRLGEPTSFWNPALVPSEGFVHVDVNPDVPGVAYPDVKTLAVRADIAGFVPALLDRLAARAPAPGLALPVPDYGACPPGPSPAVRPEALMGALQTSVVDAAIPLLAESGNSFTWATRMLKLREPNRFRVSTGVGAMGHMSAGVVGVAAATGRKAVALVGDGALLMNNEINTAVKYGAPAVWIVLNDARYNMCHQGLAMLKMRGPDASFPRVDFAALAAALGAQSLRVEREEQLLPALEQAKAARGPFLLDVLIDPDRVAPSGARNQALVTPPLS